MKSKSRFFLLFLSFFFIFFSFNSLAISQANVSRSTNWRSTCPRIVVDSAGNLHVVWSEIYNDANTSGDAFYCKYDNNAKTWGTPLNLSNSSLVHSDEFRTVGIAIDGSDRLYVVYVEREKVKLRIYSGGSWGSAFEVSSNSGDCDTARVAVDSSGNIFVCWWVLNAYRVYSRARIGGNWESVKYVSTGQSKFPDIAVGNNTAFCTWTARDAAGVYKIYYARRNKGFNDSWSAAQQASPSSIKQQVPVVEIDSNDTAHVVFTPLLATGGNRIVQYIRWTGNGFTSPVDISQSGLLHYPSLHERGNNLYASWQVGGYRNGVAVRYNTRINGNWTGERTVPNSGDCTYTDVATSPSQGDIYFVWDAGTPLEEIWCNMGSTGPPPPPPPPPTGEPVANFVFSPTSGAPPLAVTFDASSSYDSDGSIVSYSWNFGDGATGSGRIVGHTYTRAGTFTIRLTVQDNDGKTDSATQVISLTAVNTPPIAEFNFSPTTGIFPLQVTFDASGSRDPDGSISQYSWDFGDGHRGSGRVVNHTYTRWGTFLIRLTVRDNVGATAVRSKSISVLRLQQPLSIRWVTHADESLFQIRYVTEVSWERNPENDNLGAQIVLYRIYRKKPSEGDSAYRVIGEVTGDTYRYMDKDVGGKDLYTYTVTALDNSGHESPIVGAASSFSSPFLIREMQNREGSGKIIRF